MSLRLDALADDQDYYAASLLAPYGLSGAEVPDAVRRQAGFHREVAIQLREVGRMEEARVAIGRVEALRRAFKETPDLGGARRVDVTAEDLALVLEYARKAATL
jgi:hypothetical protein